MSNQYVLSRRKALTLFGISAASIAAATTQPNPSAAHANTGELDTIAGSARSQYIFGYGSLVQRESRMRSWASAEFASPVIVKGVARGWFDQTGGVSWNPTFLGGVLDKNAICNCAIFPVTSDVRRNAARAHGARSSFDWCSESRCSRTTTGRTAIPLEAIYS